jgi:isopentenyl-diphosphate delta-isomerase
MDDVLILVDEMDRPAGFAGKREVHERGLLHRAFSIFLFNSRGEMLLQRRAEGKYHSAGLWTNACCGHPLQNEGLQNAANRRLKEELNITAYLREVCSFQYKAELDNGMIENELDHIFTGITNEVPVPDPQEVSEWKYVRVPDLVNDVRNNPSHYTEWFKIIIAKNLLSEIISKS